MSRSILGVVTVVVALLSPTAAPAWFWPRASVSCAPAPVFVYAAGPVAIPAPIFAPVPASFPVVQPAPFSPGPAAPPLAAPYAAPTAAPPSPAPSSPPASPAQASPPLQKVQEERSSNAPTGEDAHFYDPYPVATRDPMKPAGERCSVAFWNLSDRDMTLKVAGQVRPLPRGKSVSLQLGRKFTWQVDERRPQEETVAASDPGLEIVIRR
jgi:hypothetical protein